MGNDALASGALHAILRDATDRGGRRASTKHNRGEAQGTGSGVQIAIYTFLLPS